MTNMFTIPKEDYAIVGKIGFGNHKPSQVLEVSGNELFSDLDLVDEVILAK